jgi:hypothetical protein
MGRSAAEGGRNYAKAQPKAERNGTDRSRRRAQLRESAAEGGAHETERRFTHILLALGTKPRYLLLTGKTEGLKA